ncbi:MAG TPA: SDR family NAD(P)-dependent oxidoreductase [Actinomycetes bacterium]
MKVLVTGGTGGLGLATASALATAGATVALTGRSGERASSVAADLPGARPSPGCCPLTPCPRARDSWSPR